MAIDTAPYQDTTYSELETGRSSFSSMHHPCSIEGNITSFSSTGSHPSNRFTIFEDPDDVMRFATSHIEFSHTWPSYASCVDDNKENYEGDEDADDEAENPNAGSTPYASNLPHARGHSIDRATSIFPNSSSAMEPVRSIQDGDHELEHIPDYAHTQETPMNTYHDRPFRHFWASEAEGVVLLPASPPRHSHLSVPDDFDADDEADQDVILTNSGYDHSMNTHYQDEMGYFYRPFPTLAEAPELSTIYSPLTEIPSMSPICPEIVTQGPRRPRRPRVRFPVV
ncbi:uncharacterized protein LDX57_011710 [Aspergillus melleus]|uniref:uncharacterized protein n=1 Tax=Aspergillus melleus TaxID=138277 RepID=UPI001E8D2158|nr:uncharacterized protein LDX57_011710 [Aspergillus melleus]KAH8434072.1 hypothetical protein LDX57_011710 [Aspergillus melleus]